jgi:exopolysaccharide production protein ExoQ
MSGAALRIDDAARYFAPPQAHALPATPAIVWFATVVSVAGILLTNTLGFVGALAFVAAWPLVALRYGRVSMAALSASPRVWIYPFFVLASVLWSTAASASLRYGIEYVMTVAGALLAARLQAPRALVSALTLSMLLVAVASVIFGTSEIDPLTGVSSFVGLFGSKNQVGLLASMMLLTSLALLIDRESGWMVRLLALVAIAADGPLLYASKSGTSFVTTAIAVMVLVGNLLISRLERRLRARVVFALLFSLLPVVGLIGVAGDVAQDFIVNVMGKDTTLTGRTVLWEHAFTLIPLHPLGGVGAGAFWLKDTVEAESLWHEFRVVARAGFHFHDSYIEDTIELGYAGLALLVLTLAGIFIRCLRWSWSERGVMASLMVSVMTCLLIRSFVEVDFLAPFQIGTMLLFVVAAYGWRPPGVAGETA